MAPWQLKSRSNPGSVKEKSVLEFILPPSGCVPFGVVKGALQMGHLNELALSEGQQSWQTPCPQWKGCQSARATSVRQQGHVSFVCERDALDACAAEALDARATEWELAAGGKSSVFTRVAGPESARGLEPGGGPGRGPSRSTVPLLAKEQPTLAMSCFTSIISVLYSTS